MARVAINPWIKLHVIRRSPHFDHWSISPIWHLNASFWPNHAIQFELHIVWVNKWFEVACHFLNPSVETFYWFWFNESFEFAQLNYTGMKVPRNHSDYEPKPTNYSSIQTHFFPSSIPLFPFQLIYSHVFRVPWTAVECWNEAPKSKCDKHHIKRNSIWFEYFLRNPVMSHWNLLQPYLKSFFHTLCAVEKYRRKSV